MSVDWIRNVIYWTDSENGDIYFASTSDGIPCHFVTGRKGLGAVVIHPGIEWVQRTRWLILKAHLHWTASLPSSCKWSGRFHLAWAGRSQKGGRNWAYWSKLEFHLYSYEPTFIHELGHCTYMMLRHGNGWSMSLWEFIFEFLMFKSFCVPILLYFNWSK